MIISGFIRLEKDRWDDNICIGDRRITRILQDYIEKYQKGASVNIKKGLGEEANTIPDCRVYAYFTNKECTLEEAQTALLRELESAEYDDNNDDAVENDDVLYDDDDDVDELHRIESCGDPIEVHGDVYSHAYYTGYSEWTVCGLRLDTLTAGGHDLKRELSAHEGEYVHLLINE